MGNLEKVFKASEKQLMDVKGVGKKTAEDIARVIRARASDKKK